MAAVTVAKRTQPFALKPADEPAGMLVFADVCSRLARLNVTDVLVSPESSEATPSVGVLT